MSKKQGRQVEADVLVSRVLPASGLVLGILLFQALDMDVMIHSAYPTRCTESREPPLIRLSSPAAAAQQPEGAG